MITSPKSLNKDTVNIKRASNLTIDKASEGCSLVKLIGEDKPRTMASIVLLLNQLKSFVVIKVDDDTLYDWAEIISSDYYWFRIEDLILAFKSGISNKQYGELLGSDILQWCREYEIKRTKHHVDKHNGYKENYDSSRNSETKLIKAIKNDI